MGSCRPFKWTLLTSLFDIFRPKTACTTDAPVVSFYTQTRVLRSFCDSCLYCPLDWNDMDINVSLFICSEAPRTFLSGLARRTWGAHFTTWVTTGRLNSIDYSRLKTALSNLIRQGLNQGNQQWFLLFFYTVQFHYCLFNKKQFPPKCKFYLLANKRISILSYK
jgi:hypothetical protein